MWSTQRANRIPAPFWRITAFSILTGLLAACQPSAPAADSTPQTAPNAETHPVTVTLTTPSAGWTLEPVAAYALSDAIWVIHQLHAPQGMSAQMISEVADTVALPDSELPVRHFVLGKTWAWDSNPELTFIDSLDALQHKLKGAQPIPLSSNR